MKIVHCLLFFVLFTSCSGVSGKLSIMEGNFQRSRGMYTKAVASYMKALEHKEAAPYSEFGLGSVYFAMGEADAALTRFAQAGVLLASVPPDVDKELRYRIHYNTGVVLFSEGDFSGAVDSFREALVLDGGRKEAKRNLELSIRSLERENRSGSPAGSGGADGNGTGDENESMAVLFEYIRQKEFNQWKSREWQEEEAYDEPDY